MAVVHPVPVAPPVQALAGRPMDEAPEESRPEDDLSDEEIVEAASDAASEVVFSRLSVEAVHDLDIAVTYDEGVLEVDVYLHAPTADSATIADDAALAAQQAVDDLLP